MGAGAASASRQRRGVLHRGGFLWWWEEGLQLLWGACPCRRAGRTPFLTTPANTDKLMMKPHF